MLLLKYITMLMLTFSIAVAGFSPAQAKSECQMAVKMQMQQMDMSNMQGMANCQGCDKATKHEQKKSGCCGDAVCSTKCSSSSSMSMNLPTMKIATIIGVQARLLYPADAVIASAHLNSQERPPKSLA